MHANKKMSLYLVLIIVLIIAHFAFRLLNDIDIEQTSILFVGIPALITLLIVKYAKTPKSAYGVVFLTMTIFLLLSSVLLGEGTICIIMMAPIFYAVAAVIVFLYESFKDSNTTLKVFIILPALLIMGQGHQIGREAEIKEIKTVQIINGTHNISNLEKSPNFLKELPRFFKMGFPKPISIEGTGMNIGDYRKIAFESNTKGIGILHLAIDTKTKNSISFKIINDDTHINHWLTWKQIKVSTQTNNNNTTTVTWTSHYRCDLGPSWYFQPIEDYGVNLMNEHLISSFFNQ